MQIKKTLIKSVKKNDAYKSIEKKGRLRRDALKKISNCII